MSSWQSQQKTRPSCSLTADQRELYAVKWAVEQWRPYLLGRKFIVETDHANLKWLCSIAPHKD